MRQQEDTKISKNRIMQNQNIPYWIYVVSLLSNMFIKKKEKYNLLAPLKLSPTYLYFEHILLTNWPRAFDKTISQDQKSFQPKNDATCFIIYVYSHILPLLPKCKKKKKRWRKERWKFVLPHGNGGKERVSTFASYFFKSILSVKTGEVELNRYWNMEQ